MKLNILSIEMPKNFCSISLNIYDRFYYKEYLSKINSLKNILNVINSLLIENNFSFRDVDVITFGDYPNSITNIKSLNLLVNSLSLSMKIPILRVPSMLTISLEVYLKFNFEEIFIVDGNTNLYYYKFIYKKNYFYKFYEYKNLNEFLDSNTNLNKIFFIINSERVEKEINKIYLINVKKNLLPKALYSNLLARNINSKNLMIILNKMESIFLKNNAYKEYNSYI